MVEVWIACLFFILAFPGHFGIISCVSVEFSIIFVLFRKCFEIACVYSVSVRVPVELDIGMCFCIETLLALFSMHAFLFTVLAYPDKFYGHSSPFNMCFLYDISDPVSSVYFVGCCSRVERQRYNRLDLFAPSFANSANHIMTSHSLY